jgi:hypothetical protein
MASINYGAREIAVKIVYVGSDGSGCNTNFEIIRQKAPKLFLNDMVSLPW